jgi:predicted dehydrogenase
MKALRFIVVGFGARARYWLRVLDASPHCAVVGLVDPDGEARSRALAACPDARAGADLAEMIGAVDADAVLLSTPPHGRERQIEAACPAGLAILAEKPLADSIETARAHVETAERAGVMLMVGLNFRYLAVTAALQRLFEQKLGRPEFARFTYERWRDGTLPHLNKYPLAMAQPMLWEQSIHHFDLLRFVYGAEPIRIFARTYNPSWSMYADAANVSALIEFEDGPLVSYHGTWQSNWAKPGFEWRNECPSGVAIQRDQFGELAFAERDQPTLTPVELPPYEQWIDDAAALLRAFIAAYRGEAPLQCSGRDHLKSLRMVQACIRSSETGRAIDPAGLKIGPGSVASAGPRRSVG